MLEGAMTAKFRGKYDSRLVEWGWICKTEDHQRHSGAASGLHDGLYLSMFGHSTGTIKSRLTFPLALSSSLTSRGHDNSGANPDECDI